MQLDLNQREVEVLQEVVNGRMHELLMEIANTDARDYREDLKEREDVLQTILAKLGCVHPPGRSETVCSNDS